MTVGSTLVLRYVNAKHCCRFPNYMYRSHEVIRNECILIYSNDSNTVYISARALHSQDNSSTTPYPGPSPRDHHSQHQFSQHLPDQTAVVALTDHSATRTKCARYSTWPRWWRGTFPRSDGELIAMVRGISRGQSFMRQWLLFSSVALGEGY